MKICPAPQKAYSTVITYQATRGLIISQIGYVVQSAALFPHMTVGKNISLSGVVQGQSQETLLAMAQLPEVYANKYPDNCRVASSSVSAFASKHYTFQGIVAYIVLLVIIVFFVHATLFMATRRSAVRFLSNFIEGERAKLEETDYRYLSNRYSSMTSFFEPFPDREDYPVLYSNALFDDFVKRTKKRTRYFLLVSVVGAIILGVIAALLGPDFQ